MPGCLGADILVNMTAISSRSETTTTPGHQRRLEVRTV